MSKNSTPIAFYVAVFCSGFAALIYQAVWVRIVGNSLGNTVYAAAMITAFFMLALGVGTFAFGGVADRLLRTRAQIILPVFAAIELFIAVYAFLLIFMLPTISGALAAYLSYTTLDNGWHVLNPASHLLQILTVSLLLTPAIFAMGASIPFLLRAVLLTEDVSFQKNLSGLYATNTIGAAIAVLLVDYWIIRYFGITRAQYFAVVANLLACVAVVTVLRRHSHIQKSSAEEKIENRFLLRPLSILFLTGFVGLSLEIIWFRYFISILGASRFTFSSLLFVILLGIWLGAWLSGRCRKNQGTFIVAMLAVQILSAMFSFIVFRPQRWIDWFLPDGSLFAQSWFAIWTMIPVILLPAIVMGATFPLLSAYYFRRFESAARFTGQMYLFNTLGAACGAIVTGFVLLPWLGMQSSVLVLAVISLGAVVLLYDRELQRPVVYATFFYVAFFVFWLLLPQQHMNQRSFVTKLQDGQKIIHTSEGLHETINIVENQVHNTRGLYTNGHNMSDNNLRAQRYMRAFAHVPLLMHASPTDALLICHGVGNTLHALTLHSTLQTIDVVDLSQHVLEHASFFTDTNKDSLKDPRVSVFINDGRNHLYMYDKQYDLITLEPPPISQAHTAALYSREFYETARMRLKPDGYLSQWLPMMQVDARTNLMLIRAFLEVFPNAVLFHGDAAQLILIGKKSEAPVQFDPDRFFTRTKNNPALLADLQSVYFGSPVAIAGAFMAGPAVLQEATRHVPPVTDDNPANEYVSMLGMVHQKTPGVMDDPDGLAFCPKCASEEYVDDLQQYRSITRSIYMSRRYLKMENPPPIKQKNLRQISRKSLMELRDRYPYLKVLLAN